MFCIKQIPRYILVIITMEIMVNITSSTLRSFFTIGEYLAKVTVIFSPQKNHSVSKIVLVLLTAVIVRVYSKSIGSSANIIVITPIEYNAASEYNLDSLSTTNHQRQKREAYDPYDVYYFYPKNLNQNFGSNDDNDGENSYINRRDAEHSNRIESQNGQKYKYTPLFQYKSTQSRRRKLFVPNLFG